MEHKTVKTASKKKASAKAKGQGAKKTSAKRKPEPIPTDPLVVSIDQMPAVPALRHALVSWGTGQGQQADLGVALLARELCEKHCHFCGQESSPTLHLGTSWDKVELCGCLERKSLGVIEYAGMMQEFGRDTGPSERVFASTHVAAPPSPEVDAMDDFKRKYGRIRLQTSYYEEFLPDWRNRIPEILDLAKRRLLPHAEVIYANRCACGNDFSVTAGMIVRSVNRHGSHLEMKKCKSCRETLLAATETSESPMTEGEQITRPKNKKKGKNRHIPRLAGGTDNDSRLVASTGGDVLATMGDVLGTAIDHLRQEAS